MDWTISPFSEAHLPEVKDLARRVLTRNREERQEAYWRWKHFENPFGTSLGAVAQARGAVVGVRLFLCWEWVRDGRIVRALRAVDTATDPGWQRRGVFHALTSHLLQEASAKGFGFIFNTPNSVSRRGYLKLGWRDLGRLPILIRPPRFRDLAASIVRAARFTGRTGPGPPGRPIEELLSDPHLETFLTHVLAAEHRLHTHRTREYLRWRYSVVPDLTYRGMWDLDETEGAMVIFRVQRRHFGQELTLCEAFASPGSGEEKLRSLLSSLTTATSVDYSIALHSPRSIEHKTLRRARFLPPARVGPRLTVMPLEIASPLEQSDWRLALGDFELF